MNELQIVSDQAVMMGKPVIAGTAAETTLIKRINRGLSAGIRKRYAQLTRRLKKRTISAAERQELLDLTHELETQDADRAAALAELAQLRCLPVVMLMKQLGIEAPPIRG